MAILDVNNVCKSFSTGKGGAIHAVDGVSLQIEEGKIYGLLGPNGAGKSTLIHLISGVLPYDKGSIEIFGMDLSSHTEEVKNMLGVVSQELVFEPAFTVEEVLYYFSGMYGVSISERKDRIAELLEELDLTHKRHDSARRLSGGMKRRLMIAKALVHRPKLLILDEPTAGVDVSLRHKIWNLVERINREGTTILFTTHYLEEAEELCESITLIDHGKVVQQGKLSDIQKQFSKNVVYFELFRNEASHPDGVRRLGKEYEFPVAHLADDMARIIHHYGENLKSIRNESASLEQIFLEVTELTSRTL